MALPNANAVKSAVETIYSVFSDDKTRVGTRFGVQRLNELIGILNRTYGSPVNVAQTDSADANVAAFIGVGGEGEILAANSVFRLTNGASDLTDNAFATAKGGAVAAGDVFAVNAAGNGVDYLGNNDGYAFDFAGETSEDFVSLGS